MQYGECEFFVWLLANSRVRVAQATDEGRSRPVAKILFVHFFIYLLQG